MKTSSAEAPSVRSHCDVCGEEYDAFAYQVLVPGSGVSCNSFDCAAQVSAELGLASLTSPARRLLEDLARTTVRLRSELAHERVARAELVRQLDEERGFHGASRDALEADRRAVAAEQARLAGLSESGRRRRLWLVEDRSGGGRQQH